MSQRWPSVATTLTVGVVLVLGVCAHSGARLVEAAGGTPLRDTEFTVWIDDGVRCVTTPCPTGSREWRGRTDARGGFEVPEFGPDETATVHLEGYLPARLKPTSRTVRLERRVESPLPKRLTLRARFARGGDSLEIRVTNPGPESLSVVHLREESLARYGDWGGWHLLIKAGGNPYLPFPLPGPYVPATQDDVLTLEAGDSLTAEVDLAGWRQAVPGTPQVEGRLLRDERARITARVRWSGMPEHLRADDPAPRIIASARR